MRPRANLDPKSLTIDQASRLLGVSKAAIDEDIAAGAPIDPRRRINLVHYAAWLNQQVDGHGD